MKKMLCATMACLLLIMFCSCKGAANNKDDRWPITMGETTFTHSPKRVVTLSPAMTDTLFALGYGGRIVGVSDYCDLPDTAQNAVTCGTAILPNTDVILQLSPDILFASTTLPTKITKRLEEASVQIVVVEHADTLEGILENYRLICTAFEGKERGDLKAEQLSLFMNTTLDYINDSVSSEVLPEESGVIYLRELPFVLATGDTLEGKLLEDMGFTNQGGSFTGWCYPLEAEAELNPSYIFCDESVGVDSLQNNDYYKQTAAVSSGRVYTFDARVFERQAPMMFFKLEDLMKEAFPDAFGESKPSFVMPMPEPQPEVKKTWWEKIFSR